jgi:hypothetical protein
MPWGHVLIFWNLLDGGPSHNRPLLGLSESVRGGTLGTNPHPSILVPPALREVKLLVHVSSVDCQPTWLRIEPPGSQFKDLISSSAHRGS